MPAKIAAVPAPGASAFPSMTLDSFKGQFDVTALLNKVVLDQQRPASASQGTLSGSKEKLLESLRITDLFVEQFQRYLPVPRHD